MKANFKSARLGILFIGLVAVSVETVHAGFVPNYLFSYTDAWTGDNAFKGKNVGDAAGDSKTYYDIDLLADIYQIEQYERPTTQSYKVRIDDAGGAERYAAEKYFGNLDIRYAKYGFDELYMYFAIEMFSRNEVTDDGVTKEIGLVYEYDIRFSDDVDGRGGFLLRADNPEDQFDDGINNDRYTFNTKANLGYFDTDDDVGGRGLINGAATSGLAVTKDDELLEEKGMNGYDEDIISDGHLLPDKRTPLLWTRIDPDNHNIVEFVFAYRDYGLDADYAQSITEGYLDFETIKGDPRDPANYFWNDKYTGEEGGSPNRGADKADGTPQSEFGTQGLVNIYELDTLRGIGSDLTVIPEPSSFALAGVGSICLIGFVLVRRRREKLNIAA